MGREVQELIQDWPDSQRAAARRLRRVIQKAGTGLEEGVKWGAPTWYGRKNVCAIHLYRDHVNLQFFDGASLPDPARVLEGTGKGMRHVKFRSANEVDEDLVTRLVRAAAKLHG